MLNLDKQITKELIMSIRKDLITKRETILNALMMLDAKWEHTEAQAKRYRELEENLDLVESDLYNGNREAA
jgi:hypothetical protein